ncbi:DUF4136 domain-containing protein [Novosphingobium sp. FSY-8]|uniref:DUF4136 domain-containing protein n=1 Tax=Novosphingobium ovatum TaxID=1908523 RepID=A0ABW9XDI5_9SPHN|nr:DUF4136 domain-containing protein [Novosphingobium ovatum]NBC36598.1 DUF4136 domain-containing protein [Novosphingobium ovatum]
MNGVASRLIKAAVAGLLALGLSACATGLETRVTRFQTQLPAPQGQSFAIVPDDPALAGGIEFAQYARDVATELSRKGYAPAASPDAATLIVRFAYGVDKGRTMVQSSPFADPFWSPWYGYAPHGRYGYGYGYMPGAWGWGWHDPFNDRRIDSYTVYASHISLKIEDRNTQRLFEGRAEALSPSNKLQWLVPNLVQAMFTGFPGNSGETLRITVAPEKPAAK